jgi:hypothetical protein
MLGTAYPHPQTGTKSNQEYRGFKLYGGSEPITETLLGHVN